MRYSNGFSLFELIITLAIISILTALCMPFYTQHMTDERRLEAKITLEKLAAALQNYYMTHNTYQGANLEQLGFSTFVAKNNYKIEIADLTDNTFSLTAIPQASQAQEDALCKTLILSATGGKNITGNGQISDCWGFV